MKEQVIPFSGERVQWTLDQSFSTTLARLRSAVQAPSSLKMVFLGKFGGKKRLQKYLTNVANDAGLMILGKVAHGRIMGLLGGPAQAQLFLIGNPLVALTMMRAHSEAGVYAPLRVMLSATDSNSTTVTYDRPSRVFAQWTEPVFEETGKMLDGKMEALIRKIAA